MHGNDCSTSQISVGWIDLFDDNMENIVATYRILIKSIDNTYRIGSVKRYRALVHTVTVAAFMTNDTLCDDVLYVLYKYVNGGFVVGYSQTVPSFVKSVKYPKDMSFGIPTLLCCGIMNE